MTYKDFLKMFGLETKSKERTTDISNQVSKTIEIREQGGDGGTREG